MGLQKIKASTGVQIAYEEHGSGPSLLLIHGLGYGRFYWWKQIPFLSRQFRLIAVDLRGCGASDAPAGPYTIPQMAQEVGDVIAAAAGGHAHVLGHSLGGFVALELAVTQPAAVDGLVLASTALGGPSYAMAGPEVLKKLVQDPALSFEANLRRNVPVGAAPGYFDAHPEDLEEIIRLRLANPITAAAQFAQNMAGATWPGVADRLAGFAAPALILHGDADQVVPVENARRLKAALPDAELRLLPGVGHQIFIEAAPMVNREIALFLSAL